MQYSLLMMMRTLRAARSRVARVGFLADTSDTFSHSCGHLRSPREQFLYDCNHVLVISEDLEQFRRGSVVIGIATRRWFHKDTYERREHECAMVIGCCSIIFIMSISTSIEFRC